ncbi:ABC transporter substrate-binding protein [Haloarcula halophila]|nr:ABC transporter substrate-binding protein [Halomicroarcula sp. DFY41]
MSEDRSYSVTMSPVGTVEFERPPETATVYDATWADILVGLGHGDAVLSLGHPEGYYAGYYDQLDGVSFDTGGLAPLYNDGLDKEQFYELDADVHHLDPVNIGYSGWSGWSMTDVEEIEENIGPFVANRLSRAHAEPPAEYGGDYEYYSLWELTEKLGQVYREAERAAELQAIRDGLVTEITADLPSRSDRPSVGLLVFSPDEETFSPYKINAPGYGKAQYRPFGVEDAFADSDKTYAENYEGSYDIEGLLEVDPDVIVHNWDIEPSDRTRAMRAFFADNPVARELTAVQNDRVYVGGTPTQGPVMNIFQIEMTAKQLFPERFGEWNGVGEHSPSERLFDRQRLADSINGDS